MYAGQDLLSSHVSEESFVYLVQNESFFFLIFNSRKIVPTKEMPSIALIILRVKNWPQRSKPFDQLLKSKI